jgi:soluble lytic murein transglycosylase
VLHSPILMKKRLRLQISASWLRIWALVAAFACIGMGLRLCSRQQQASQTGIDPILTSIDTSHRRIELEAIINRNSRSLSAARARYILASEAIDRQEADRALAYLQALEGDYPILTPQIIWKRAQAYELLKQQPEFLSQIQLLDREHSRSPVVVEAWNIMGRQDEKYWNLAIEKFPSHPRTLSIIEQKIAQTPNRPDLLLILVKYLDDSDPRRLKIADRLVVEYPQDLQPEEWDLVGEVYWQNKIYHKSIVPLSRGSKTASNAYKIARSYALSQRSNEAKIAYQEIISQYSSSQEACKSLIDLADLSPNVEALNYLDRAIDKFPDLNVQAYVKKADILERNQNQEGAVAVRTQMVKLYPHSEEVAAYRWELAKENAKKSNNLERSWALAKQIVIDSPNSKYSPRAAFWIGKWAQRLGMQAESKEAFTYTVTNYTRSYYSWRSAKYLGWDVGDFYTTKSLNPKISIPTNRLPLPTGSDALKELYLLGQDRDTWELWQAEFLNRKKPEILDRLNQSIILNRLEKYITSVVDIAQFEELKDPEDRGKLTDIYKQLNYWHTLYPLAFINIIESLEPKDRVNPLLIISVIRQESRFSSTIRSPVGALGLMQVMPSTAKFTAKKIGLKDYELTNPVDNIKLGSWYLKFTHQQVKNNSVLAIAGYNAGPTNVSRWVKEYGTNDLDEFVEQIPFEETQNYVKAVLGNYWNYLRLYDRSTATKLDRFLQVQN